MITRSCGLMRLGLSVLLTAPIIYLGCSPKASDPANVVRPVKTNVVASEGETRVRSFPGKLEASKKAELAFQVRRKEKRELGIKHLQPCVLAASEPQSHY
jgi:hypothetical protein